MKIKKENIIRSLMKIYFVIKFWSMLREGAWDESTDVS